MQQDGTVAVNTANHYQLTEDEINRLRSSFKKLTTSQAAYPLQAAVLLTPLVLLVPTQVCHWQWNQADILQVCYHRNLRIFLMLYSASLQRRWETTLHLSLDR